MSVEQLPFVKSPLAASIPNEKLIKVLMINPNATKAMTMNCLKIVEQHIPMDTIVYGYTGPAKAPLTIEGHLDGVMSAAECIRDVYPYIDQVDSVLVACFSDHPLTNCIREEFDKPCVGIMEAALYTSRVIGGRFGVVGTVYRGQIRHIDAIREYGLEGACAGYISTGLAVSELESKPREEVLQMMCDVALELVNDRHADVLILGCAGMSDMKAAVEATVKPRGVEVIDGVVSGVNLLSGLNRAGLKTAKRGLFASSKESRLARGQTYL